MVASDYTKESAEEKGKEEKKPYEPPAIIYKGIISTRAGSPAGLLGDGDENAVDPADLFGDGG